MFPLDVLSLWTGSRRLNQAQTGEEHILSCHRFVLGDIQGLTTEHITRVSTLTGWGQPWKKSWPNELYLNAENDIIYEGNKGQVLLWVVLFMPSLIDFSCTDLAVGLESSATNNRRSGVLRARNLHENNYSSTMVIPRAFEIRDVIYWVFFF